MDPLVRHSACGGNTGGAVCRRPHTKCRPTTVRRAGPERPKDAQTWKWLPVAPGPHLGLRRNISSLLRGSLAR